MRLTPGKERKTSPVFSCPAPIMRERKKGKSSLTNVTLLWGEFRWSFCQLLCLVTFCRFLLPVNQRLRWIWVISRSSIPFREAEKYDWTRARARSTRKRAGKLLEMTSSWFRAFNNQHMPIILPNHLTWLPKLLHFVRLLRPKFRHWLKQSVCIFQREEVERIAIVWANRTAFWDETMAIDWYSLSNSYYWVPDPRFVSILNVI
jgi:hypothetical protein